MPKPQKGRNLKPEQKIEIARKVCEMYATDRYTIMACLNANGIESATTWKAWQEEIGEIAELYKGAVAEKETTYKANLKERARTMLEKHLDGYTVELEETEGEAYTDLDGNPKMRITRRKKKQIYVRPSIQAAVFVLTNVDGVNFKHRPEPADEIPTKTPDERLLEDWTDEEIEEALKKYENGAGS